MNKFQLFRNESRFCDVKLMVEETVFPCPYLCHLTLLFAFQDRLPVSSLRCVQLYSKVYSYKCLNRILLVAGTGLLRCAMAAEFTRRDDFPDQI